MFYIDYGNVEFVVSSELKQLTESFCKLPAQAIECELYDLIPNDEVSVHAFKLIYKSF